MQSSTAKRCCVSPLGKFGTITLIWVSLLTSCYSVPETPDFTINIARDYKQVSDCAWLKFRTMEGWSRDNLDSLQRDFFVR